MYRIRTDDSKIYLDMTANCNLGRTNRAFPVLVEELEAAKCYTFNVATKPHLAPEVEQFKGVLKRGSAV
jgi:hypothetical protein